MKKTITFMGKELKLAFNMQAQFNFLDLANKEIFNPTEIAKSTKDIAKLWMACILSADPEANVSDLLENANWNDLKALDNAVGEMMKDFYVQPAGMPVENKEKEEGEDPNPSQPADSMS